MWWIKANRWHNTGIGKTLEDHLWITENNIALPDFWVMELKSQRKETGSMITLFTKKPEWITNQEILTKYWYPDKEHPDVKVLHQTIWTKVNWQGFFLKREEDKLVIYKGADKVWYYTMEFLQQKVKEKIWDGVILVLASERKNDDWETEFRYEEAYLIDGLQFENLINEMFYDIRMGAYKSGDKKWKPHDHWSGFRIRKPSLSRIFQVYKQIL